MNIDDQIKSEAQNILKTRLRQVGRNQMDRLECTIMISQGMSISTDQADRVVWKFWDDNALWPHSKQPKGIIAALKRLFHI